MMKQLKHKLQNKRVVKAIIQSEDLDSWWTVKSVNVT
jgi:hypothetical protein